MHRRGALLALLVAAMLAGSGCARSQASGATGDSGPPRHGGSVTMSISTEPPIINPWLAQGAMSVTVMMVDGLSDPLVTLDDKGAWQPVLAERVPTVANGDVKTSGGAMTIDLDIRQQAHWSDGAPLDCRDVVFTWQTVINPKYQLSNRLGWDHIDRIECPAPRHVHIVMSSPYALYTSRILAMPPLPRHELEDKDFNTVWNDHITVSSGPFEFVEWQRGVRLVLRRSRNYWNAGAEQRPYLDRVTFRFVKDANTLKMQLRMTEADIAQIPPDTNLVDELKATPDVSYAVTPGAAVELLGLQTASPNLHDRDVRQAVAYGIDRAMVTSVILKGMAPPMQQAYVPTQPIYADDAFARYAVDGDKVAEHMKAAGYTRSGSGPWLKDGKPLNLTWVAAAGSMPYRARIAQLVQEQLRRQGIGVTIELSTPEVLYSDVAPQGKFDIGEWSEPTGVEPAPNLLYACDQIPKSPAWAGKNRFRWCNPDTDALMRSADTQVVPADRAKTLATVDGRVADNVVVLPLFRLPDVMAWNRRVHGIVPNPAASDAWNIDQWWVSG